MPTRGVTFTMPVTVVYDDQTSDRDAAVGGFYRILEEAEQAGLMGTAPAHISYGEPRDTVEFAPQWEEYFTQPSHDDRAAAKGTGTASAPLPQQPVCDEFAALVDELTRTAQSWGVTPEDLDDMVHDAVSREASAINDRGLDAQIARLVQAWGAGARAAIHGVILTVTEDDLNDS